jgi:hypothetical protein
VKTKYTPDPELEQDLVDTSLDLEQDFEDISLETEQILEDIKPNIKGKILMVHKPVKDTTNEKLEKRPRYEIRPSKFKLSIDLNRPVDEEEHGLKTGRKVKEKIKPKIEANRDTNDNNQ